VHSLRSVYKWGHDVHVWPAWLGHLPPLGLGITDVVGLHLRPAATALLLLLLQALLPRRLLVLLVPRLPLQQ
jgi:hypothetical protein